MEEFGFIPSALITFCVATLLQATMIWQLIVLAGVICGVLARNFKTAILAGVVGILASWLMFLLFLGAGSPGNFGLALSFFSIFLVIGIVLVIMLGLASASLGYFFMRVISEARSAGKRTRKK